MKRSAITTTDGKEVLRILHLDERNEALVVNTTLIEHNAAQVGATQPVSCHLREVI